ncbi:MAG TPA: erythromycin esterase family protein [Petrimonas sp.]|nr:erythromycin esterase family protein [Petrimonas sp.]
MRILLGEKCSQPYLQLLNDRNYKEVIDLALGDSQLQSVLDTKDFDYLLFLLEESVRTGTIFEENTDRKIYMGRRAEKIIQLYLKAGDKAVIHAHTSHTNKMNDFFNDVVEKTSMGNYIYRKYGEKYFSIGFQAGKGLYTQDDTGFFSKTVTDTLQTPIPASFEYSALKTNNPYSYYPSDKLPDGIFGMRAMGRERKNVNLFFFCSVKKRFNGLVFIRDNSQLHDIEPFPAFYTRGLIQFKDKQQREFPLGSKVNKRDR